MGKAQGPLYLSVLTKMSLPAPKGTYGSSPQLRYNPEFTETLDYRISGLDYPAPLIYDNPGVNKPNEARYKFIRNFEKHLGPFCFCDNQSSNYALLCTQYVVDFRK